MFHKVLNHVLCWLTLMIFCCYDVILAIVFSTSIKHTLPAFSSNEGFGNLSSILEDNFVRNKDLKIWVSPHSFEDKDAISFMSFMFMFWDYCMGCVPKVLLKLSLDGLRQSVVILPLAFTKDFDCMDKVFKISVLLCYLMLRYDKIMYDTPSVSSMPCYF